jgi:hypothetical protein
MDSGTHWHPTNTVDRDTNFVFHWDTRGPMKTPVKKTGKLGSYQFHPKIDLQPIKNHAAVRRWRKVRDAHT